ncbi:MAG: tRNA uridine-5-carboxymethylaminomethyl(34) synthesis GTPase MnmE, partial [Pseudomonadota bacterium]
MAGREDTIVAIATGPSRGGIGVVRISGPAAFQIAKAAFRPQKTTPTPWPSHKLLYGEILNASGERIDDGLVVRMAQPHSYTGEEVIEFQGHGSPVTLQEIVSSCLSRGARLAEPGEFTKRAFLNGRIDLVQAEAVADLIYAESEAQAKAARRRLEGRLSATVERFREETLGLLAECEAAIDFPEEGVVVEARPALLKKLAALRAAAEELKTTYVANRRLSAGFCVVLVGRPNVGKSSLFNALLKTDRAIVMPSPGTTRDALREELVLSGVRVRLIDTAGLRKAPRDDVERMGMIKTEEALKNADLSLVICDASEGFRGEDKAWLKRLVGTDLWLVWNKSDLRAAAREDGALPRSFLVSAL